jgi:prepilin-type processing-associated H-X9-DG protein
MSASTPQKPRLHRDALISFLLGLSSVGLLLLVVTGVPAMILGLRGLRAVNSGGGQWRGARLAIAGMALGLIGTVVTLVGAGLIVAWELRASSARAECTNHLREIGVALNKYADARERFPAATIPLPQVPPERRPSWMAEIVPLLGEGTSRSKRYQDLAKKIDRTKGWDDPANAAALATPVRLFLCPGDPQFDPNASPGLTNYVGVAGINPGAVYLSRDDPRAGMFGYDRGVRRQEVTAGISFTMMVLETENKGFWLAGGQDTVRGLDPDEEQYNGPGRPFGGLHPGVVNVLFVDGSVRPLSDSMPGEEFRRLATLRRQVGQVQ